MATEPLHLLVPIMHVIPSLSKITTSILIASILLLANIDEAQPQPNSNYSRDIRNNTVCSFITANNVSIRNGAGKHYKIITKLNRGEGVRATYKQGNWVKIAAIVSGTIPNKTFKPLQGWVYNAYINGCSEDQFDRWRS